MRFVDGDLYERSFETPAGHIDVLAEIVVTGSTFELRDIVVYPRDAVQLTVSPGELLGWARLAVTEIADEGFAELRVTGTRLTGAGPGRRLDLTIRRNREPGTKHTGGRCRPQRLGRRPRSAPLGRILAGRIDQGHTRCPPRQPR